MSFRKSLLSFYIYSFSEYTQYYYTGEFNSYESVKRILYGTFTDSIVMRHYHKFIDNKLSNHFAKMFSEFIFISPLTTSTFLLLNNNFSLNNWYNIYTNDLCYWSVMSTIGYKYFLNSYRFVFVSFSSYIWSNYRIFYYSKN